jgi:hypothetical protein
MPLDLLPLFLEHVNSKPALAKLCLVSKAWYKYAQPLLFRAVFLPISQDAFKFKKLALDNPQIGAMVKTLALNGLYRDTLSLKDEWQPELSLGKLLPYVRHLSVTNTNIPSPLLLQALDAPSLKSLSFHKTVTWSFSASVRADVLLANDQLKDMLSARARNLEYLACDSSVARIWRFLQDTVRTSSIDHLALSWDDQDRYGCNLSLLMMETLGDFIESAPSSVTHLALGTPEVPKIPIRIFRVDPAEPLACLGS